MVHGKQCTQYAFAPCRACTANRRLHQQQSQIPQGIGQAIEQHITGYGGIVRRLYPNRIQPFRGKQALYSHGILAATHIHCRAGRQRRHAYSTAKQVRLMHDVYLTHLGDETVTSFTDVTSPGNTIVAVAEPEGGTCTTVLTVFS